MDDIFDRLYERTNYWSEDRQGFIDGFLSIAEFPHWFIELSRGMKEKYKPQTLGLKSLCRGTEGESSGRGVAAGATASAFTLASIMSGGAELLQQSGLEEYSSSSIAAALPWIVIGAFEGGRYINKKYKEWRSE